MWILMDFELSVEALFALWLVRRFGVSGPRGFRSARIVYCTNIEQPCRYPERVLALTSGCLMSSDLWEALAIPSVYRDIIQDYRYDIQYDSGAWPLAADIVQKLHGAHPQVIRKFFRVLDVALQESRNERRKVLSAESW